MHLPFKLLLKNPQLNNYTNLPINSNYIKNILGLELTIPNKLDLPFLFSCFALSVDGKLSYPDTLSGFNIALANKQATAAEKAADLWYLMLARTISDALIIGTNSLQAEKGTYLPDIIYPKLKIARQKSGKSAMLWTLIPCRDLNSINFNQQLLSNENYPVILCLLNEANCNKLPTNFTKLKLSALTNLTQLSKKNLIIIDTNLINLLQKLKLLGLNVILNESPFSHHYFLQQQLLDEIWVNYSCSYIGGIATSLGQEQAAFTSIKHPDTEILTLHHLNFHFLYSRQKVIYWNK